MKKIILILLITTNVYAQCKVEQLTTKLYSNVCKLTTNVWLKVGNDIILKNYSDTFYKCEQDIKSFRISELDSALKYIQKNKECHSQ